MKIYCMSDIHGCLAEFEYALSLIEDHLDDDDTMLILLGDYIHGGDDNYAVLDKVMQLQRDYGSDKVMALMGNHEDFVLMGESSIDCMVRTFSDDDEHDEEDEEEYLRWMESLPLYYTEGNTIFVHAGIDEDAGDMWEWSTGDETFVGKYPADIGSIDGLDMKIVAGHIGTAEISGDPRFHDIYYDGESHYYIDGSTVDSGVVPVLLVDTDEDKYYRVTESGAWPILPYYEEV
ncbi:MAG: metallophosphoesterase [Lachnospiraceae bacterium]|nr:metallophosphoesterase [Lachnospiraceae bacterium]